MAKQPGRKVLLKKDGTKIAGGRTVSMTWNGAGIDTTDEGSGEFQEFLAGELATDTMEITIDGLETDGVLRAAALTPGAATKHFDDLTLEFPTAGTAAEIAGDWVMTSYSETGEYQDAVKFTATFVRNGAHTFSAGGV